MLCCALLTLVANAAPLRIVTTFYPLQIATLNITSNAADVVVSNLTPPTSGCLHDYQLTPADLARLAHADVLIINGGGLESFLEKARRTAPRAKVIEASAGIELLAGNPHVWVSPELAARQAENIGAALAKLDAQNAELYRRNAAAYAARLRALTEKMRAGLKGVAARQIITLHEAFPYFAREFGFTIAGVVEREPGAAPDARELADTIKLVREQQVRAIFVEPQYPTRSAEAIARATGAKIATLDPAVTGPVSAEAYLQIMENNLAELQRVLK